MKKSDIVALIRFLGGTALAGIGLVFFFLSALLLHGVVDSTVGFLASCAMITLGAIAMGQGFRALTATR